MASEVTTTQESENKSFASRLCELPVAVAAIEQLSQIYNFVKERNSVTKMACNAGESTINMANSAAQPIVTAANSFQLTKPIFGGMEYAAATFDRVASGTLAKVEEKCPIITKTPTEIKTAVSSAASTYYNRVHDTSVVKMVIARTEDVVSFTEIVSDFALPPDGSCDEDMKDLQTIEEDQAKGPLVRIRSLQERVKRRATKKLLSYKPVQFTVDKMGDVQDRVSDLVGMSASAGLKVYGATMHIPKLALELSGEVYVSAKNFVFAFTKAYAVSDVPATVANMMVKASKPLSDAKDTLVGHVSVHPQVMTQYLLSSRPVQWMLPHIVGIEDLGQMNITMTEAEDEEELDFEDGEDDDLEDVDDED